MSLMALGYLLLYFGGLGAALVRHPMWGLYAYFLAFYVHPPSRWWSAEVPDLRWAYIAAIATCIAVWIHHRKLADGRPTWLRSPLAWPLIAYTGLMWIQTLWAVDPTQHLEGTMLFTKYLVVFYLIYKVAGDAAAMRNILMVHIAGCFFFGWLAVNIDVSGRLDGIGGPGINNANTLGMQLGTGVVIASAFILLGSGWWRWLTLAMVPFIVNGAILTGSRGAFLGMAAGALAIWYLRPRIRTKLFYALGVMAVAGFLWLAQDTYWERISTIEGTVVADHRDTSSEIRVALFGAQWRMVQDHPFGVGWRGTATLSPRYLDQRYLAADADSPEAAARSSHNTFMSVLVEQGIVGVLIYGWLVMLVAVEVFRLRKRYANPESLEYATHVTALGAVFALLFVAGMFTDYLMAEVQYWCLALLASLMAHAPVRGAAAIEASGADSKVAPEKLPVGRAARA